MQKGKAKAKGKGKGPKPKAKGAKEKAQGLALLIKPGKAAGAPKDAKPEAPKVEEEIENGKTLVRNLGPGAGVVPSYQTFPPTKTVFELFPEGNFPEGELSPYKDNTARTTPEEQRASERLMEVFLTYPQG